PGAVAPAGPKQRALPVRDRDHRQHRDVAGALPYRRAHPAPRLPPFVGGKLPADVLGLVDVHRHDGPVPVAAVPVPALPADDLDRRDARDSARSQGGRRMTRSTIYGLLAEFEDPTSLVAAAERTHRAGFRSVDAYSPYPIEELHEALGSHHTRLPLIVLIGGLVGCLGGYAL